MASKTRRIKPQPEVKIYRGYSWDKRHGRWRATIKNNTKQMSLGNHLEQIDAAIAYDKAAIKIYGERALLNFPEENYRDSIENETEDNVILPKGSI